MSSGKYHPLQELGSEDHDRHLPQRLRGQVGPVPPENGVEEWGEEESTEEEFVERSHDAEEGDLQIIICFVIERLHVNLCSPEEAEGTQEAYLAEQGPKYAASCHAWVVVFIII